MLSLQDPNHIPSLLDVFISRPDVSRKARSTSNKFCADSASATKVLVSSAYWDKLSCILCYRFVSL